ncbi:MAG: hypothetical protein RLZZ354_494 [Pseudomonadota bacterium]|jgi:hypothetical protein
MAKATKPKQTRGVTASGTRTTPKVNNWKPAKKLASFNTGTNKEEV